MSRPTAPLLTPRKLSLPQLFGGKEKKKPIKFSRQHNKALLFSFRASEAKRRQPRGGCRGTSRSRLICTTFDSVRHQLSAASTKITALRRRGSCAGVSREDVSSGSRCRFDHPGFRRSRGSSQVSLSLVAL